MIGLPIKILLKRNFKLFTSFFFVLNRLLDHVRNAIQESANHPGEKHVNVLLKTSSLGRALGGTVAILCKSGD